MSTFWINLSWTFQPLWYCWMRSKMIYVKSVLIWVKSNCTFHWGNSNTGIYFTYLNLVKVAPPWYMQALCLAEMMKVEFFCFSILYRWYSECIRIINSFPDVAKRKDFRLWQWQFRAKRSFWSYRQVLLANPFAPLYENLQYRRKLWFHLTCRITL